MQDFVCEIVDVDGQDLFAKCGFQMIEILRILDKKSTDLPFPDCRGLRLQDI